MFSGFIFVVSPCSFNVLPLCLAGCGSGFLGEFFLCFLLYKSLDCFRVKWCLFWSVVPFFASRSAVSLPCIPTCEGTHWKATVLPCLLRSFIVPLASFTVWVVACLFEAAICMADLESTRRMAFWKAISLRSSSCSAVAIAVIAPSRLVLLLPTEM